MRDGPRDALNPEPVAERGERADDIVVERHMSERRVVFRGEIEMGQADGVAHVPVHDRHRQDRLRLRLDRRPGADMIEQAPRPVGDRDRAQRACARPGGGRRIDDGDGRALAHRLLDRGRERQSGRAAAGDDDVEDGSGFGQCGRLLPAHCRTDDKSIPALGPHAPFSSPDLIFSRRCGAISESLSGRSSETGAARRCAARLCSGSGFVHTNIR